MYRSFVAVGFLLLTVAAVQFAQQPSPAGAFAIEHVTVINVETGARSADQTVVVTGNQISAVGSSSSIKAPTGSRTVDGRGKFLIPGIWDMHIHALHNGVNRTLPLAVSHGITDVRDMASSFDQVLEARKAVQNGLVSPRLVVSGPALDGVASNFPVPAGVILVIKTPAEGRQIVQRLAAAKLDLVKIHNEIARDTYFAIADEAKRAGLPFDGHLPSGVNIIEASDAGQRTIEHLNGLQVACAVPNTKPPQLNRAKCEETVRHLAKNGTWLTPTIGAPGTGDKELRQFNLTITRIASEGGVRLLTGTDGPGAMYAAGNYASADRTPQDDLAAFVEAGLTPVQALRTATLNPVIMLKMTDRLGAIERGKLGDLVLLNADPLVDITNTKRIAAVIVNGRLVDAAMLKKLIEDEEAARKKSKS